MISFHRRIAAFALSSPLLSLRFLLPRSAPPSRSHSRTPLLPSLGPTHHPPPTPTFRYSVTMVNPTTSSPWRVVVTRRVPTKAMDMLRDANLDLDIWDSDNPMPHEALVEKVSSGCDALYCVLTDKIGKDVLDAAGERLKMISTMSVGYNHIDYPECKKRGIPVSHTPNVLTETTADTAVALVLAACRRFKEATASVIEGTWGTWTPMGMCGQDVHDATVGIIGMGRIGSAVARRLHAFNCNIIYWGIERVPQLEEKLDAKFVEIDYLLKEADIVIPLCPLNKETYHMFDMSKFKAMKKSAVFVNPARGELVNQDDLLAALQQGEIFSAGLDVTTPEPLPKDHPLVKTPNCFILPHIGSASMGTRTAMAVLASENLVAAYKGKPLPTPVREF